MIIEFNTHTKIGVSKSGAQYTVEQIKALKLAGFEIVVIYL